MRLASRLYYYRRICSAYLGPGRSHLSFWHEVPEVNPRAFQGEESMRAHSLRAGPAVQDNRLGEYYMLFRKKADYAGPFDGDGIPLLDYHGAIGPQYNPIAIAQWGLANYNAHRETRDEARRKKALTAADWLCRNLEPNSYGLWVWNHHFDWEYRDTLKAPWYSGLAQAQGVSLLLRAHAENTNEEYLNAARRAFVPLTRAVAEGGVLLEDEDKSLWIEEYLVDPPTHILNGFIWALWGVFDFSLACLDSTAKNIFDRGVQTLVRNLSSYDTGYWSLYEQSTTWLKMLASPFYHRLHIVQLRVMAKLTGESVFTEFANRWEGYANRRSSRTRALFEKTAFKLLYY